MNAPELVPHHPSLNPVLDAVDLLSKQRVIHTWLPGYEHKNGYVHSELHPPLLILLHEGTGLGRAAASSETRIPIDADALEMEAQIRERLREMCRAYEAEFDGTDLCVTIRRWYIKFENARIAHRIEHAEAHYWGRVVDTWVKMIEAKFDPDEVREWTDACPARLPVQGGIGYTRCGARRIIRDGNERFAIKINATRLVAECAECGTRWEGWHGLAELRVETNRAERERQLAEHGEHGAE